jgi:hypothetical protein
MRAFMPKCAHQHVSACTRACWPRPAPLAGLRAHLRVGLGHPCVVVDALLDPLPAAVVHQVPHHDLGLRLAGLDRRAAGRRSLGVGESLVVSARVMWYPCMCG